MMIAALLVLADLRAVRAGLRGALFTRLFTAVFIVGERGLGRGHLTRERAPERRHQEGRSRKVPHSLEVGGCKVADSCLRLV